MPIKMKISMKKIKLLIKYTGNSKHFDFSKKSNSNFLPRPPFLARACGIPVGQCLGYQPGGNDIVATIGTSVRHSSGRRSGGRLLANDLFYPALHFWHERAAFQLGCVWAINLVAMT